MHRRWYTSSGVVVRFSLAHRNTDVDVADAAVVRGWLMARLREEVRLKGQPHPRVILLFSDHEETLDLNEVAKKDPTASGGATFQALRGRPGWARRFLVLRMITTDPAGAEREHALLFEELDGPSAKRRWWLAFLPFTTDPVTGLGLPAAEWQVSNGETDDPRHLFPFLHEFVAPSPGARAAVWEPPPDRFRPDLKFAFGEIPAGGRVPATPRELVEFAFQLAAPDLLTGAVSGTVVVRLADRAWEQWVVGDDVPTTAEDMVRYIANVREPPADAVAMVIIAIRPTDEPPVPGVQVVGELGGHWAELWGPIEFPEGAAGPKVVQRVAWWEARPVPPDGMFLHVRPKIDFVPLDSEPEA